MLRLPVKVDVFGTVAPFRDRLNAQGPGHAGVLLRSRPREDWGVPNVPGQIIDDIEGWVASWNGEKRASKKQRTLSALFDAQLASQ